VQTKTAPCSWAVFLLKSRADWQLRSSRKSPLQNRRSAFLFLTNHGHGLRSRTLLPQDADLESFRLRLARCENAAICPICPSALKKNYSPPPISPRIAGTIHAPIGENPPLASFF